ncbi:hypothetical protein EII17_01435 [Clostridiales bacterium COT073_COT-073]|nr:hypothetical protein EII17_01435 [Clostridiales bacterium COT073_COT-073]
MKETLKKDFQNRIANAGRKDLVLIHFDMILAEMDLIDLAFRAEDWEQFRNSIQLTQEMIKKLVESLDFSYEISHFLMGTYQQINGDLIKMKISKELNALERARRSTEQLREAFSVIEAGEEKPLIQNGETIYAGLTYGKDNQLKESVDHKKRGLKA